MSVSELKSKNDDQLRELLVERRKEQFNLRFQAANGQVENTARVRVARREVARIKTLLTERRKTVKS